MTELNKTTKKYLKQLLPTGILYLLVGVWLLFVLFKGIEKDPFFDFAFAIIGIIFGYWTVTYFAPGGRTNFSLVTFRNKTADEETFNKMIIFYKSNLLITSGTLVVFIFVTIIYISNYDLPFIFNFNNIAFLVFWNFLTIGVIGTGIKYLSAWWKIKRKLKI